jgi:uncharacterized protein YdbL (DUF1318 family)
MRRKGFRHRFTGAAHVLKKIDSGEEKKINLPRKASYRPMTARRDLSSSEIGKMATFKDGFYER